MIPVEFLRHSPPYAPGEHAWFRPEKAEQLVRRGEARFVEVAVPSPDSEDPPSDRPMVRDGLPLNWRELTPNRQRAIALRLGCPKTYGQVAITEYLEARETRT